MNNKWTHSEYLVADIIRRSRYTRTYSSALLFSPNIILSAVLTLLLIFSTYFLLGNNQIAITSSKAQLNEFLPANFGLSKNFLITGRYSNQYGRSASALSQFIFNKVSAAKISDAQAEKISAAIIETSHKTGLDPLLIAAIIKAESAFKEKAKSPVGAVGLMQLMPPTAKYIGKKIGLMPRSLEDMYSIEKNLILGSAYFIYLHKMFHGNIHRALVAYNWGPRNAELAFIKKERTIPRVTQNYSKHVLATHKSWKAEFEQKKQGLQYAALYSSN